MFKFKFHFGYSLIPTLESLKSFFDSWKGRPILLQTIPMKNFLLKEYFDLIIEYKTKGTIKRYDNDMCGHNFGQFEWIQKKVNYCGIK